MRGEAANGWETRAGLAKKRVAATAGKLSTLCAAFQGAGGPGLGLGKRPDTLTCNSLRVSYRIQAFFWNPGGVGTCWMVRLVGLGSLGFLGKAVSNRKQTAVGFETGWRVRRDLHPRESRVIHRNAWPKADRAYSNGPDEARVHSRRQI